MLSCIGTISRLLVVFRFGGSSGSPVFKLSNLSLTSVCAHLPITTWFTCNSDIPAIGFVYFASYTYFTSTYWPHITNMGKCAGEEFAAFAGCGILSSYLVLFISFYFTTYRKGGKRAAKKAVTNGNIALDPKLTQDTLGGVANGNGHGYTNGNATNGSAKGTNGSVRSRKA